ncbi:MAG: rhodanese-like domain-containing protein [bacterium]|nr:rhodanese-like domain-containing protein [bacterium]
MFGFMKGFSSVNEVTVEEAHSRFSTKPNEVFMLDVRTAAEYQQAHVEGSVLIPVQDLAGKIHELEEHKGKEILVICRSGNRSFTAAAMLKDKGFDQAFNVTGGVMSWYQAGLPLKVS